MLYCSLIFVLFVSCESSVSYESYSSDQIIGNFITIGSFNFAQNDFPEKMNWHDAVKACNDLGDGWRLPTKDELFLIYYNRVKIGGFHGSKYWSSSSIDEGYANTLDFNSGDQSEDDKNARGCFVRAVRAF